MLEKQLREIKELREQLDKSPIVLESPFKTKGLKIVAMPIKGDKSSREYNQRQQKRQTKINTTLTSKLQGYKVA